MAPVTLANPLGSGQIFTPDHQCQNAVVPKLIVIVQVLVAQGDPQDPLGHQAGKGVFPPLRGPMIGETPGQTAGHIQHPVGLAQEQRTTIR